MGIGMNGKLTKKQKTLASIITLHKKELLKRYSGPRLAQYVSGVRIPEYDIALHFARVADIDIELIAYRKLNI